MPFVPARLEGAVLDELVRAVARDDRALLIDAANTSRGWRSVDAVLRGGSCFAVVPARDVLALDADDVHAVRGLDAVVAELDANGARYVRLASGGEGREHLFARISDRLLCGRLVALARRWGVDARVDAPIRPPGVRHRSGAASVLLVPRTWDEALGVLARVRDTRRFGEAAMAGLDLARYRRGDGTVDDSRVALAALARLCAAGVAKRDARAILEASDAGASLRKRHGQSADAWFDRTWDAAVRAPRRTGVECVDECVDDAWAAFLAEPRAGVQGSSDTAVFAAACELAKRAGSAQASMAVRELAVWSGKDPKTVRRALARLECDGWLVKIADARLDAAAVWEVARVDPPRSLEHGGRVGGGGTVRAEAGCDAVRELGTGAWRVLEVLHTGACRAGELAERTGLHPGSIRRILAKLEAEGLVTVTSGVWAASGKPVADAGMGVWAGWRERREARFAAEQEAFERVLDERPELAIRMLHSIGVRPGGSIWAWRPRAVRRGRLERRAA
jgi:DNA-binding MarR family transcriptional regulator